MKVILLAAGRSKRMFPIEDKNFLEFLDKPLLMHQIEMIMSAGFKDIVVMGGKHNLEKIRALTKKISKKIEVREQKNLELGMCGAVLSAALSIKKEPVLIVSSNDIVDKSAFEIIKKAFKSGQAESYILGKKVKEYFPGGYLKIDKNGFIKGIVEKPLPGKEPSDMVNLVLHLHTNAQKLIKELSRVKSVKDDLYEVALDNLISGGMKVKAVPYGGFWQPIKYPWHIQEVFRYFFSLAKKRVSKKAKISKKAFVNGEVIIEDGVKIFDGATVNGPCYIGKNSVIATNALVRDSHLGENCVIGFASEVARSFLQNDVWTHSNYIGDSVISNNVSFGAGAKIGNLRLDEKNIFVSMGGEKMDIGTNKFGAVIGENVRVGINTSIMPGIKIGGGTFIASGIVIGENIPEKKFVTGKFELKILDNREEIKSDREKFRKKLK